MIAKILSIAGAVLMAAYIITVCLGNGNGWQFLTPAIIILALGGLSYDLSHPRPRRPIEEAERPRKRRKVKATSY